MLWWEEGFCRMLADGGRFVIRYHHRDTGRSVTCGAPRIHGRRHGGRRRERARRGFGLGTAWSQMKNPSQPASSLSLAKSASVWTPYSPKVGT
ncbi:MAG: hypothetical protein ACRDLO_12545 [Solirubrobacterales bacterium]